jgi:hypothetical protein
MPTPDMDLQIVDQFASQLASRNNLQTVEAVLDHEIRPIHLSSPFHPAEGL